MYNHSIVERDCSKVISSLDASDLEKKFKNKKILITGANGLIGGFFVDFFVRLNKERNLGTTILATSLSECPERIIPALGEITYFSWDASMELPARQDIEDIDCVFYCSGYGQPAKFLHDKTKTILLNLVGVNSCIKKVKDGGSFLFLSTSEVYGDNPITPTPEDFVSKIDPQNNRFCYIAAKQLAETICLEQSNRINIKIARIALTYGPGTLLSDTRVLQSFIFRAHNEDKIQLLDAGDSIRNYLYISECVHKLLVMLLYGKEAIYNVGGYREPISIFELAKMIGNKTNRPVFKGVSANKSFIKDAPKSVCLNMSKYNKEFKITDFEFVGIKEGIQNLMEWYGY